MIIEKYKLLKLIKLFIYNNFLSFFFIKKYANLSKFFAKILVSIFKFQVYFKY